MWQLWPDAVPGGIITDWQNPNLFPSDSPWPSTTNLWLLLQCIPSKMGAALYGWGVLRTLSLTLRQTSCTAHPHTCQHLQTKDRNPGVEAPKALRSRCWRYRKVGKHGREAPTLSNQDRQGSCELPQQVRLMHFWNFQPFAPNCRCTKNIRHVNDNSQVHLK